MEEPNLSSYFRRLRKIYCREQQLIRLLPELVSEAISPALKEAMGSYLAAARCRRYMISDLARNYGVFAAGDECVAMKKLIAVGQARLAGESRGESHDPAVESFCYEVHRAAMVEYGLTRNLAAELRLHSDLGCFNDVLESLAGTFPKIPRNPSRKVSEDATEHALL